jgi:phage protein U
MLYALGPVLFDIKVNPRSVEESEESAFAVHEVVGTGPVYEDMGEGQATFSLSGKIYPEEFGGLAGITALKAARVAKTPVPLIRGDFVPQGWFLINSLRAGHGMINEWGVGREVDFEVELFRTSTPGAGQAASILRLFG